MGDSSSLRRDVLGCFKVVFFKIAADIACTQVVGEIVFSGGRGEYEEDIRNKITLGR